MVKDVFPILTKNAARASHWRGDNATDSAALDVAIHL